MDDFKNKVKQRKEVIKKAFERFNKEFTQIKRELQEEEKLVNKILKELLSKNDRKNKWCFLE